MVRALVKMINKIQLFGKNQSIFAFGRLIDPRPQMDLAFLAYIYE